MSEIKDLQSLKLTKKEIEKSTLKLNPKEKKLDVQENQSKLVKEEVISSREEQSYTVSPDGKYKIPVSEFDSDRLEENKFNIPSIKIPGWVIVWPHDVRAGSIPNMVNKGWIFVSPTDPGCEAASQRVVAGRTQGGETAFHYPMKMPEAKFKELMAREEKERKRLLESIEKSPSKETKAIYATDQMKFNHRDLA